MNTLDEIRAAIKRCRNTDNAGCIQLTAYREQANVEGASHPVLFQAVPNAKIMLIGAVPGSIDADASKAAYQRLVRGQFSLGHKSAQGLGEIMTRVGKTKNIDLPVDIIRLPDKKRIQENHLLARDRLGLHVTNLVKCHAPPKWESNCTAAWRRTANACTSKYLTQEVKAIDPSMVVLLGRQVADYISESESWRSEIKRLNISTWAQHANYLPFYGKSRFVTAWTHPGGPYFWTRQGRKDWDMYAEQMAQFVN